MDPKNIDEERHRNAFEYVNLVVDTPFLSVHDIHLRHEVARAIEFHQSQGFPVDLVLSPSTHNFTLVSVKERGAYPFLTFRLFDELSDSASYENAVIHPNIH